MKYDKKHSMPGSVQRALLVAGKSGFLSRDIWNKYFASGKARWNRRQLQRLMEGNLGLLQKFSNPSAADKFFVLTLKGQYLLEKSGTLVVGPPPVAQLVHDEVVCDSLLHLEKSEIISNWKMESELKKIQMKDFVLNNDPRNKKYPDAVFDVLVQNRKWPMALEYERTCKSALRYRDILWLYSRLSEVMLVIFICENSVIENTIRGQIKRLHLPKLFGRVAFVHIDEWRESPSTANLKVEDQVFCLKDFRSKPSKSVDPTMALNVAL